MRKVLIIVTVLALVLSLTACGRQTEFDIKITIPAGSMEEFAYADEILIPTKSTITVTSVEGLGDSEVTIVPVREGEGEQATSYITPGMPVKFEIEKDAWYKIGVSVQNATEEDITVTLHVKGVELVVE
ncbi:MAG: hypothetical protein LUH56_06270 [Oscillospiraceae bacterium]|nr:hypothetical protein [Oscillospiraceae bacterium]